MSESDNRDLLAQLKQDVADTKKSSEPQATKEHIAGAAGKLASATAQHQGQDPNQGGRDILRSVDASGEPVDRDAIQAELSKRAKEQIRKEVGEDEWSLEKGSEASRLQSAAEQYGLGREGKQAGLYDVKQ